MKNLLKLTMKKKKRSTMKKLLKPTMMKKKRPIIKQKVQNVSKDLKDL